MNSQVQKIIKSINFHNDIDKKTSGIYEINEAKGYVEFLYEPIENIEKHGYMSLIGDMVKKEDALAIHPIETTMSPDYKMARGVFKFPLDCLYDNKDIFLCIDFTNNMSNDKDSRILISLINDYWYNEFNSVLQGHKTYNQLAGNNDANQIVTIFKNRNIYIYKYKGLEESNQLDLFRIKDKMTRYMIHINQWLKINKKHRDISVIEKELKYVFIGCDDYRRNSFEPSAIIHNIVLAQETGYLYFNPFTIEDIKNIKLNMEYSGDIQIEYCGLHDCKWRKIKNNDYINCHGNKLKLRCKMKSGSKIYRMIIGY